MSRPERIVIASNNQGKLREIRALLADWSVSVVPQSDFHLDDADEIGLTFVENAIIKARHAAQNTGLPAIADDSGIEVDLLGGEPGIHSARYGGADASDEDNLQLLLKRLGAHTDERPTARFQCVMVFMRHASDPTPVIAQSSWEGYIVPEPRGENGFGYDPVFFIPEYGCTSAELEAEVKNRISHRGQALRQLLASLSTILDDETIAGKAK